MGARKLTVTDPEDIIEDMPAKQPVGRNRRKAEYQAERREKAEAKKNRPLRGDYPGHLSPQEIFPEWDWEGAPWGPPLDDPRVATYCDLQWRLFLKHAGVRKRA